jgi:hypothetical protein
VNVNKIKKPPDKLEYMNWMVLQTVMKAGVFAQRIGTLEEEDEPDEGSDKDMNNWGVRAGKSLLKTKGRRRSPCLDCVIKISGGIRGVTHGK